MKRARWTPAGAGFTLIELMVVVAILGILAALAYPGYARYVVKTRRAQAQAALLELMHQQERHFTRHNTYVTFSADAGSAHARHFRWWSGSRADASSHELRGEPCPDQPIEHCIVLQALPGTARVDAGFRDPDCGTLTLKSTGARASDGGARECWP